jgi:GDP-4-dehydro-6-deoxy-D-mannose reductase
VSGVVLVTGAAGFAGSHLVDRLLDSGVEVAAWSHRGGRSPVAGNAARWQAVDLLARDDVDRAIDGLRPDVVYHCAGRAAVGNAWTELGRTLEVNVRGTLHLLGAVERHAPHARVIVTSSALVYRHSASPIAEDAEVGPEGPYAVSKFAQDRLAASFADRLHVVIARPFNHIGPRQTADFLASSVARQVARIERGVMPPQLSVGNLSALRDFTDVRDVVAAYDQLASRGAAGGIYNVCSGRAVAVQALVDGIVARAKVPIEVVTDPARFRPVDVPVVVGSCKRLEALTGWSPTIPLERTLDDLLAWWRQADTD